MNTQCPFCNVSAPSIAIAHNEFVWNCCDDLPVFVEESDPNDETGLLKISYSAQDAIADWQACAAFAAEELSKQPQAA